MGLSRLTLESTKSLVEQYSNSHLCLKFFVKSDGNLFLRQGKIECTLVKFWQIPDLKVCQILAQAITSVDQKSGKDLEAFLQKKEAKEVKIC